ncbi:type VI secretion system contractile sheath large subunit [Sansalvadorimonas sp. 2012CJ34-2]|uniref:Type VI secretion system contractile sheath large subunit n=1 Tax=Parendozoicomonas callyspongiae TaxID=2942213 RepID=A0ABT0PBS5_9GAMM|nr:type VI secretion system contractile sheath large subunit [Sansalvadorimonas sp. 2012CJ34-2]MCL6268833.1 type VI secretion system contractile sheath large subunit [Sansalvadorimonas sp. 2012CJ34-2]
MFDSLTTQQSKLYQLIIRINDLINKQVSTIVKSQEFKLLWATWYGLFYLASDANEGQAVIRILNMSWPELITDITMKSHKNSRLYHLLHGRELDSHGGEPFGLISVNYNLSIPDQPLAEKVISSMADLGLEALCPFLFDLDETWLTPQNEILAYSKARLDRFYENDSMMKFRRLRTKQSSRFIGIVWPGIYITPSNFESWDRVPHQRPVIGGSIALLACVLREYNLFGWFSGLQAWGNETPGGAILPPASSGGPEPWLVLTEALEEQYDSLGIIPLATTWYEHYPAFFSQTMLYFGQDQYMKTVTLCCMLMVCRIGHYLKVILRKYIGVTKSASECQWELNSWLNQYCGGASVKTREYLSKYPLQRARVEISPSLEEVGHYKATVTIQPSLPPNVVTGEIVIHISYKQDRDD